MWKWEKYLYVARPWSDHAISRRLWRLRALIINNRHPQHCFFKYHWLMRELSCGAFSELKDNFNIELSSLTMFMKMQISCKYWYVNNLCFIWYAESFFFVCSLIKDIIIIFLKWTSVNCHTRTFACTTRSTRFWKIF